jgi:hypothetical protein
MRMGTVSFQLSRTLGQKNRPRLLQKLRGRGRKSRQRTERGQEQPRRTSHLTVAMNDRSFQHALVWVFLLFILVSSPYCCVNAKAIYWIIVLTVAALHVKEINVHQLFLRGWVQ